MNASPLHYAFSLHQQGRLDEARDAYQQIVREQPRNFAAYNLLGQCCFHLGALQEALKHLNKSLKIKPDFAAAHRNLGDVQNAQGDRQGALRSLRRAFALDSSLSDVQGSIGTILNDLGRYEEALDSYRVALAGNPQLAWLHRNQGVTLARLGRHADAQDCFRRALALAPDFVEAHNDLGNALNALGQNEEAERCFRRALEINPGFAPTHVNLAANLFNQGRLLEAESHCRKALEIKPDFVDAHVNLGASLLAQGRYAEDEETSNELLRLNPGDLDVYSHLLFLHNLTSRRSTPRGDELARQSGQLLAQRAGKRYNAWKVTPMPERLRVGLVSGDLRNHPVGFFLDGVLAHVDPAQIELIAYPTQSTEDELTHRLRPHFSAWRPLTGKSDRAAAETIHGDGIHLLVDLSGHTASNRLPVFAWKPAPVQISWLGYWATTGLTEIDYLIADEVGVPDSEHPHFCEAIWYLPDTRLCYTAPTHDVAVASLPALRNGHVTFGCFQQCSKISDDVLTAWSTLLAALPEARLRLQAKTFTETAFTSIFLARCERFGIAASRIDLVSGSPRGDYLAAHNEVDMILDTFPYPGGTTTCDALWMGVPTLTLRGETLLARQGASLLAAAGLPEWIATSDADYVEKAIALAGDLAQLAKLRAGLRQQVLASPLFDAERFARNLVAAFWSMWRAKGPTTPAHGAAASGVARRR